MSRINYYTFFLMCSVLLAIGNFAGWWVVSWVLVVMLPFLPIILAITIVILFLALIIAICCIVVIVGALGFIGMAAHHYGSIALERLK